MKVELTMKHSAEKRVESRFKLSLAKFDVERGFERGFNFIVEGVGFFVGEGAIGSTVFEAVSEARFPGCLRFVFEDVEEANIAEFGRGIFSGNADDLLVCDARGGNEGDVAAGGREGRNIFGGDDFKDVAEQSIATDFCYDERRGDTPFSARFACDNAHRANMFASDK